MRCRTMLITLVILGAAAVPAHGDAVAAAIRHLRKTISHSSETQRHVMLMNLRELRDPELKRFFYQLVEQEDWMAQVHAVLGLAEISESGRIDPWQVKRLGTVDARVAVIDNAVDMDLIGAEEMRELLSWEDLEPAPRMRLICELYRIDPTSPDREALSRIAAGPNLDLSGLAAVLLGGQEGAEAFSTYRGRLAAVSSERRRHEHILWMLTRIREYELAGAADWVAELLDDDALPTWVEEAALHTMLVIDIDRGVDLLRQHFGSDATQSQRVRYGMLLLQTGESVPPNAYRLLSNGDPLVERIIDAGRAISTGTNRADALIELVKLGHRKTSAWVMSKAEDLDDEEARRLYLHVIDNVDGPTRGRDDRVQMAVSATTRLFDIDPQLVIDRMKTVEDNSATQQAMLMGLYPSTSPRVSEAAQHARIIGYSAPDSMAFLLLARHAEELDAQQMAYLGRIASGGGRISEPLQVQAAWLYIKRSDMIPRALTEIFSDQ